MYQVSVKYLYINSLYDLRKRRSDAIEGFRSEHTSLYVLGHTHYQQLKPKDVSPIAETILRRVFPFSGSTAIGQMTGMHLRIRSTSLA